MSLGKKSTSIVKEFESAVQLFEPRLRAYLRTVSVVELEDVIQETFLILFKKFDFFRGLNDVARQFSWLCGISIRVSRNHHRSKFRHSRRVSRLIHERDGQDSETNSIVESEIRIQFASKIASFTLEERMIAVMVVWDDADAHTVSTMCECSLANAYKKIQRVLVKLRRAYENEL